MKISFSFLRVIKENSLPFLRKYINAILLFVFSMILLFAGYIFLRYGYMTAIVYRPQVAFKRAKIKQNKLDILIADIREKEDIKKRIITKTFSSPFIKLPEEEKE